jgi:outer membrane protein assembly factor BamB
MMERNRAMRISLLTTQAFSVAVSVAALVLPSAPADDWPCWRGPARNGISAEAGWLDRWPAEGPRVLWKAAVGTGFSTFAVAGGRAFTLGNDDNTDTVFCLDAETGKVLWSHAYPSDLGDKFFEGGPTATPTVDGGRVYTIGRWGDAFCFEAATGKVVWSKNLVQEIGLPAPGWGLSGSPVVHGDLLLLNAGDGGLAIEKATGKVTWKSAAKEPGYSTPLVVRFGDAERMLLGSGRSYVAVDPRTGREAWRMKWVTQYGCNAADPVVDGDRVFLSTGYGKGAALLKSGAGEPEVVWQGKVMRTQMNPCVLLGGFLYGVDGDAGQKAALKCVDFATGAEKWAQEGFGNGAVMAADGKLIALSGKGELMVAPVSPDGFQPAARAQVLGGKCWTVPVLANGRIYCRNAAGDVVCLDVKKP